MVVITFSRSHASRLQSWRGGGVERWRGPLHWGTNANAVSEN
jgi:hypothetical protein